MFGVVLTPGMVKALLCTSPPLISFTWRRLVLVGCCLCWVPFIARRGSVPAASKPVFSAPLRSMLQPAFLPLTDMLADGIVSLASLVIQFRTSLFQ